MKTGVIIVSYHSNDETVELARYYSDNDCFDNVCIVVNDARADDFAFFKKLEDDRIHVLFEKDNLGYAKGNNKGLDYLLRVQGCDVVAISNNDVKVSKSTTDLLCERLYNNEKYGALAPRMLDSKGKEVPLRYIELGYLRIFLRIFVSETSLDRCLEGKLQPKDGIIDQSFLPGSFFAVGKEAISRAHFFDDHTFLYREEEILGKRLMKAGFAEGVIPAITYLHNHKYHEEKVKQKKKSLKIALDSEKYYFKTYVCKTVFGIAYVVLMQSLFYITRSLIWRLKSMSKSIYAVLVEWGGRTNHRLHQ